ncbi:Uncharacterized protein TPAR_07622 [Tolypocladium paradoxum]|uniref:Uncharacterized protein n=1 Tax=Tolypocladium paradoxum TaxID=94208 RepID=A0A2S4KPS3_9HYPO|nr:Uncharacterized protein TPAR_07622 [Tolypocladium paradoxum]
MSFTTRGSFIRYGRTQIMASSFTINETQYTFSGTISQSLLALSTNNITLNYDNVNDLINTHQFSGQNGQSTFNLTLDNGPKIGGNLNTPLNPAIPVSGAGEWATS